MNSHQRILPSFEEISNVLRLDRESGKLFWIVNASSRARIGQEAGCIDGKGYRVVTVLGARIFSHRIVWMLSNGKWPDKFIDHIDGNQINNIVSNLRDVGPEINGQNQRVASKSNKSSSRFPGCFKAANGNWKAKCMIHGKVALQKEFKSQEDAEKCVIEFRRKHSPGNTL